MTPERHSTTALKRLVLFAVVILVAIALVLGLLFWDGTDGGVTADGVAEEQL